MTITSIWASLRENLSSGFPTNKFETSRLARELKFHLYQVIFLKANNKGADQSARVRRLVCACVVLKPPMTAFPTLWPILYFLLLLLLEFQTTVLRMTMIVEKGIDMVSTKF